MRRLAALCLAGIAPLGHPFAQEATDSVSSAMVEPPPPAKPEPMPQAGGRVEARARTTWQLTLDFADITDSGLANERHLHQTVDQTNLCCLDLAWLPLHSKRGGILAGGFGNIGGWHQILSDGSAVTMADLSLGPTILGVVPFDSLWQGWIRLDLGVSNLLVQRHTTGMDWGWAGAVRAGVTFPFWNHSSFFGAGVDFRDYWNLEVHEVPGLTLFIGEWI